jgi:hypothetical protein
MSPFSLETASGPLRSGQRVAADNGVVVRKDIETPSLHSPEGRGADARLRMGYSFFHLI